MTARDLRLFLEIDYFPPRAESLDALLVALQTIDLDRLYLKFDRFFPWSFDVTLRDPHAYPEELLNGFAVHAERAGIRILPALSTSFIEEALLRRFSSAGDGDSLSLRGPAVAYCGELWEDLACFFYGSRREILLLEEAAPALQLDWSLEAAREQGILLTRQERKGLQPWIPPNSMECCESITAPAPGTVRSLAPFGDPTSTLPPLPGWLELLSDDYAEKRRELQECYRGFGDGLETAWRNLRLRWEAAVGNQGSRPGDPEEEAIQIRSRAAELAGIGCSFFLPPWFKRQVLSRERAYLAALLHQQAGDYSIIPRLDPMIE